MYFGNLFIDITEDFYFGGFLYLLTSQNIVTLVEVIDLITSHNTVLLVGVIDL